MQRVDIQVVLCQDGSASVMEVRQVQVGDEGTEGFITFNNMGDIEVRDLQVYDENDSCYVVEDEWNVHRSRKQKRCRCGYNRTPQGVELCWGLGDAGNRTYEIHYTLTKLVKAYEDYDGFNHSFYEAANSPAQEARVEFCLENDSLTRANAAIWTFGYYGYKRLEDGVCEAATDEAMRDGDAIIVLLQLNKGVLNPTVRKEESFAETVKRTALEGSDYNLEDAGLEGNASYQFGSDILPEEEKPDGVAITIVSVVVGIIVLAFAAAKRDERKKKQKRKLLTERFNQLMGGMGLDDLPYYRNLPINGNLLMSGATMNAVKTLARKGDSIEEIVVQFGLQQLYNAFILRMFYKNNIQLRHGEVNGRREKLFYINEPVDPGEGDDVTKLLTIDNWSGPELSRYDTMGISMQMNAKKQFKGYVNDAGIEYQLQKLLYESAGEDHLLQPNELKAHVVDNPLAWRSLATILNLLTAKTIDEKNLRGEDVQQVVGFWRYLKDFSLVAERHIEETGLWREYLVFAAFYGIAEQVRKDMKKVAPDVARLNELVKPEDLIRDIEPLADAIASTILFAHSYVTPEERKQIAKLRESSGSSYSRSSGGSGRSSYSGGGGHSGGGGSGFR
ncbi:MAG: DUF2207 domain-containing protein [Bacteroidaceae bacterium]|nr:DUF2207 domain-containing protein [Bacteroidaceae bacterium]